jgi:hypothetical protein
MSEAASFDDLRTLFGQHGELCSDPELLNALAYGLGRLEAMSPEELGILSQAVEEDPS